MEHIKRFHHMYERLNDTLTHNRRLISKSFHLVWKRTEQIALNYYHFLCNFFHRSDAPSKILFSVFIHLFIHTTHTHIAPVIISNTSFCIGYIKKSYLMLLFDDRRRKNAKRNIHTRTSYTCPLTLRISKLWKNELNKANRFFLCVYCMCLNYIVSILKSKQENFCFLFFFQFAKLKNP